MLAIAQASEPLLTAPLNGVMAFIILLAVVLALPVSFSLIRLYRRAVAKSMRARAGAPATAPPPPTAFASPHQPAQTGPAVTVVDRSTRITAGPEAEGLHAETLRAPWRAAAVYVVAGACQALIIAAAFLVASGEGGLPLVSLLFMFWILVWPAVLTINLVAASTRRAKLAAVLVYFVALAAVSAAAVAVSDGRLSWGNVITLWLLFNLPATLLLLTFLNRRVRAVGPLVLIFLLIAVIGSQLVLSALALAGSDEGVLRSVTEVGSLLGLGGVAIFWVLALMGFLVAWPVGWLVLRWVRGRYERKKDSDQSITLDAIWLLFAVLNSLVLASGGNVWLLSGPAAFLGYKVVAWAGFALLDRGGPTRKNTRLLLLRVFSLGKPSELLFGALAKHWRHVGSIQLIAGPDLATTTVEPHEFLDFLSGKLARRFIDGAETLDRRMSETDISPDRDGRYRVNDFFCHDDTWRVVLSRLVSESDAVLMDLRGFSSKNAGCAFEINALINTVPLERVGFVIDDTTDEQFLRQCVQESWGRMRTTSPNRNPASGQLRLFRFTGAGKGELRQLLRTLCVAAEAA